MTNVFYTGNDDDNKGENASEDGNKANDWVEKSGENIGFSGSGNVCVLLDWWKHSIKIDVVLSVGRVNIKQSDECG